MSNLRNAPLFLTPQVTRGLLGVGHPQRMVELKVEGRVNGSETASQASKASGGG